MNIDYTIGDDIVCIKSHSMNAVKENDLKVCLGLNTVCKCGILVDVGVKSPGQIGESINCITCNTIFISDGKWWMIPNLFKKLDTLVNINELTEILEKPTFS